VQILGFGSLPEVGGKVCFSSDNIVLANRKDSQEKKIEIEEGQIGIILKAQNAGSLEAIIDSLPKEIVVVSSGVGDVFESDVLSAKASGAQIIISFESKPNPSVLKLAEAEGVEILSFDIVYKLFEALEERIKKGKVEVLGRAEIIAQFPFDGKKIAGCRITQGKISKSDQIVVSRGETEIGKAKAISLKKQKQEVSEVSGGEEFGVLLDPQLDFKIGDMLVSVGK
jgi:translation initiation factor IF-2